MMNNFKEREGGLLFDEALWIKDQNNLPIQVRLEADSLDSARIVGGNGNTIVSGKLEFRKGRDETGRATRVLLFKDTEEQAKPIIISESVLSAQPKRD